jgi:hypothetical protein
MGKQILQSGAVIKIPAEVAVCPICRAAISVNFDDWVQEDGEWLAASCNMHCKTEPDIDDEQWWPWAAGHYSQPYIDWLPVEKIVVDWINEYYRFEIEDE